MNLRNWSMASSPRWVGRECPICHEPIGVSEFVYVDGQERLVVHEWHGNPGSHENQTVPGRVTMTFTTMRSG